MKKLIFAVALIGVLVGSTLGGLALAQGNNPNQGSSPLGELEQGVSDILTEVEDVVIPQLSRVEGQVNHIVEDQAWTWDMMWPVVNEAAGRVSHIEGEIVETVEPVLFDVNNKVSSLIQNEIGEFIVPVLGETAGKVGHIEAEVVETIEPQLFGITGQVNHIAEDQAFMWDTMWPVVSHVEELANEAVARAQNIETRLDGMTRTYTYEFPMTTIPEPVGEFWIDEHGMQEIMGLPPMWVYPENINQSGIRHVHLTIFNRNKRGQTYLYIKYLNDDDSVSMMVYELPLPLGICTYEFDARGWSIVTNGPYDSCDEIGVLATISYVKGCL